MDNLHKFVNQIAIRIFFGFFVFALMLGGIHWLLTEFLNIEGYLIYALTAFIGTMLATVFALAISKQVTAPVKLISQFMVYKFHPDVSQAEPTTEKLGPGKEIVDAFWNKLRDSSASSTQPAAEVSAQSSSTQGVLDFVLAGSPMPILGIDAHQVIKYCNQAAINYFGLVDNPVGKPLFDVTNLLFPSDDTYETWAKTAKANKVSDHHLWYRVRAKVGEQTAPKQFDLSASFSKDASSGIEIILTLFDQTDHYSQDDRDVGFLALAVHELRTPLTIMRGYIEVFEDELGPTLDPEMKVFMEKLNAAAQQLTAFVSNILNMARVEENQLTLNLREEAWPQILESAINDQRLRAQVHGKTISLSIQPGLPTAAVDSSSIREVVNNLIENAVKYGGTSDQIIVNSVLNTDGQIETTVQDFGVGIPESVLPHLFEKFYRSHRSRGTASGTGLGLYLCHAIVKAHGGTIAAESHEGKGSTFGFTLQPYSAVADQAGQDGQDGIIRGAHGWIKNHNIYKD